MHKCLQACKSVDAIEVKSSGYCEFEAKEFQALV